MSESPDENADRLKSDFFFFPFSEMCQFQQNLFSFKKAFLFKSE